MTDCLPLYYDLNKVTEHRAKLEGKHVTINKVP